MKCPVCGEELATLTLSVRDGGKIRVGRRCAGLLEALVQLMGADARREPMLRQVRG